MRVLSSFYLVIFAVPATVLACEGECIVGITNAFLGNYTDPINAVMNNIAKQISEIIPSHPSPSTSLHYLTPVLDAYNSGAYNGMEAAIFPGYFHGKCQQGGIDPPGCPNPDCPVVCGTPGSMVHFYPVLRFLAFNETRNTLAEAAAPGSPAYQSVAQSVTSAARDHARRMSRVFPRALIKSMKAAAMTATTATANPGPTVLPAGEGDETVVPLFLKRRTQDLDAELQRIFARIPAMLEDACGGSADEDASGLPDCSWEKPMKKYILTFP